MYVQRLAILVLGVVVSSLAAEQGILVVHLRDVKNRDVAGTQIRAEGGPPSPPSDDGGVARILLDPKARPGQWITLSFFKPQRDLVFVSPWEAQVIVPPFDSTKEQLIVVAERGDRVMLENSGALLSLTAS